ncbi:MAG: UDP-N-acetylmuramate dehydrogenase [Acidobacteriota bacterium]
MTTVADDLRRAFGDRALRDAALAPLTTFRVGGAAEWLVETRGAEEALLALQIAARVSMPVTILGGGSNVLVSDAGVPGLVLRPRGGAVSALDAEHVVADAAVTINALVRWTILHGAAGLEAWAGTPGTVGGAIHGNAHFAGQLIGDSVTAVRVAGRDGVAREVPAADMAFAYDRSRLQESGEVLLSAVFRVSRGEPAVLRAAARASLAFRKRTQPLDAPSAGCIFRNPEPGHDVVPEGVPWSAGALVDRAGLKGFRIGGACVSPVHGNFIINDNHATARDIRQLIEHCRAAVRARFGVELREEIVYLGHFPCPPC